MNPEAPLLEAAPNFRDFGGHVTTDGLRVRRGLLYRSELLQRLTPRDMDTLRQLEIGVICDLRSPGERSKMPCEWPPDLKPRQLALDLDADLSSVQPDKWSRKLAQPGFGTEQARAEMIENYRRMPKAYARDLGMLFEYLLEPGSSAVMIHCAVGKDRTGFVSAMLLSALGVTRDGVFADYIQTRERYPPERMIAHRDRFLPQMELDDRIRAALGVLVRSDPDYLSASFDQVSRQFGSVDAYLEQGCGVNASRRARLREKLLESPGKSP